MRVVVATDSIAGLSPTQASETIAFAFAERGAQVAVVPLGVSGAPLRDAVRSAAPQAVLAAARDSAAIVEALAGDALTGDAAPDSLHILDLTRCAVDDLGCGILAAFGADPAEGLAAARRAWAERELVVLVPQEQIARPLTGLEGHASTELRAAGATLQEILEFDAAAERWAAELGLEPGDGAGAVGGVGLLVTALGGRLADPLAWLAERFDLSATMAQADLVVTGAETLDFHSVGGPVVQQVVAWAGEQLRPVIAITGRNYISARELRLAGLETAHALQGGPEGEPSTPTQLRGAAGRVAASWSW